MPAPLFTTVTSGAFTSGAFALEQADRPLAIHVPSLSSAAEVRLTFSPTSGSGFVNLFRRDGSGAFYTVASGAGPFFGFLDYAPTPWGQFSVTSAQSDTRTFTIYTLPRAR